MRDQDLIAPLLARVYAAILRWPCPYCGSTDLCECLAAASVEPTNVPVNGQPEQQFLITANPSDGE